MYMKIEIFVVETELSQSKIQLKRIKGRKQTARTHSECGICHSFFDEKFGEDDYNWLLDESLVCKKCADRIFDSKINRLSLNHMKKALIDIFGGITISDETKTGFWKNQKGQIEKDSVRIWEILVEKYEFEKFKELRKILHEIKRITKQKCQLYTINNEPYYL